MKFEMRNFRDRPVPSVKLSLEVTHKFQCEFGRIRGSTRNLKLEKMKMVNTLAVVHDKVHIYFESITSG